MLVSIYEEYAVLYAPFMGKPTSIKRQSGERNRPGGLTAKLENLEKRVQALEARIQSQSAALFGPQPQDELPRLGRKPALSDAELFGKREQLVNHCSSNWPELVWIFEKAESAEQMAEWIAGHTRDGIWSERGHLVRNAAHLWAFIKSGRYHGDPRQVANAMAGVPNVCWRTSWNRCSAISVQVGLDWRAYRDHLRRKFPERLRELLQATTSEEIKEILDKARTDDVVIQSLRRTPERVSEILERGKAAIHHRS